MSDNFQSYVFADPTNGDLSADFRRIPAYLISEQIILDKTRDNSLEGEGHVPGSQAEKLYTQDIDRWRELDGNGVTFRSGRIVEVSADLAEGRCPHCNTVIDVESENFEAVSAALDRFDNEGIDLLSCPAYSKETKLSDWDFGDALAVGRHKVTFWNWPRLKADLALRFEQISGLKCHYVEGRI